MTSRRPVAPPRLPLSGVRVLDLTMAWAGPHATRLLADMGAEVIKLEAASSWDLLRAINLLGSDTDRAYNRSAYFNHINRNKYACSLDLRSEKGQELFLRLVKVADAVVENFRPEVMDQLGLGYEVLAAANPEIVMVCMPGHGRGGPESSYVTYGSQVEQLSGITSLTGYPGEGPHKSGISYGDPVAGATAAAAVLTALWRRRRTGRGGYFEVAQREAMTLLIGEYVVAFGMNGRQPPTVGNSHPSMAPHGVYRCRGEDSWLALAVGSDTAFDALCRVMRRTDLVADARFADVVSRHHHRPELDAVVGDWTGGQDALEAAERLQAVGVSAAPVLSVPDLMENGQLRARGFFETVAQPEAGVWEMEGSPWRLSETSAHVRLPSPRFAEHNQYVLGTLLGLPAGEVADLEASGVAAVDPDPGLHT